MPAIRIRRHGRHLAIGLAAGGLVLLTAAAVQAQDGASFFEQLFGVPQRQAPAPVPVRPSYDPLGRYDDGARRRRFRAERRSQGETQAVRAAPKTRYAALPRPDSDPNKILGKQPVDQKAIQDNPTAAILKDPTLRAGDIVVMPDGPKVFTGASAKKHRLSAFEDVKHSRLIDKKVRRQLVAMMVPIGAMPADEARKVMAAKRKLAPPEEEIDEVDDEAKEAAAPRVIAPWTTTTP